MFFECFISVLSVGGRVLKVIFFVLVLRCIMEFTEADRNAREYRRPYEKSLIFCLRVCVPRGFSSHFPAREDVQTAC